MENLPFVLLSGLLGLVIICISLRDRTPGWSILFFIGVWFVSLPICLLNGWNKAFALLVTIPLGVMWIWGAISGLLEPLYYCVATEAFYEKYVFVGASRRNHTRFYALKCKYHYGNRGYQEKSSDHYTQSKVEKKFLMGSEIQIWVNKKNPGEFKVRRYHGMFAYALLLVLGLAFLGIAGKIML